MSEKDESNLAFDPSEIIDILADELRDSRPVFYDTFREINVRCPFCGDSSKNASSAHLYISKEYPFPWNCFRCPAQSSHLNTELADNLDVMDRDVRVAIKTIERDGKNFGAMFEKKNLRVKDLRFRKRRPLPNFDKTYKPQLSYLKKRLGRLPEPFELERFKFVFNLDHFLEVNNIDYITTTDDTYEYLATRCFGNLSYDETNITFRCIDDKPLNDQRYRLYNLYSGTSKENSKIFIVRKDVDIRQPRFKIVLSEGVLDLMQVEHLFYSEERFSPNYISGAIQGKDLIGLIKTLIGVGLFPADIHIYADNEPGMEDEVRNALQRLPFLKSGFFSFSVFMNNLRGVPKNQKQDFGVPADQINRVQIAL